MLEPSATKASKYGMDKNDKNLRIKMYLQIRQTSVTIYEFVITTILVIQPMLRSMLLK